MCFAHLVWADPSHMFPHNMGKEQNLEVEFLDAAQAWNNLPAWLEKSKWDIGSVKKMLWHVPYTIGVLVFSLLHCK
jgi:hypothetical protein